MNEKQAKKQQLLIVTIRCITYNHEPYIRQCLEGFVMQKTNFHFEAIVHDDASTDGTAAIIREYAEKYPDIIKPIYETENQYSKHDGSLRRIMDVHTHGKYIAICEGDDYWTDPYKLQKQVDFLESHPDYVMCSHRYQRYWQDSGEIKDTLPFVKGQIGDDFLLSNLIKGEWMTQPLSMVYRRSALDAEKFRRFAVCIDTVLVYHLLTKGKAFCFRDVMGVYRIHNAGIWSEIGLNRQILMQLRATKAIYDVEKTEDAAKFLLFQFSKPMSRIWLLKHWRQMKPMYDSLRDFYGKGFVCRMILKKIFLNRNAHSAN